MSNVVINPYEALVALAKADTDISGLVGTRVDVYHHYGQSAGDWSTEDPSLIFIPTGGVLDMYNGWMRPEFFARCYAPSVNQAMKIWEALIAFSIEKNYRREIGITDSKTALVEFVLPLEGGGMPSYGLDDDIVAQNGGLPYLEATYRTSVAFYSTS